MYEEHELHMIVKFKSEPGWEAANKVAIAIGHSLTEFIAVIDVQGSVDPHVKNGRIKVGVPMGLVKCTVK